MPSGYRLSLIAALLLTSLAAGLHAAAPALVTEPAAAKIEPGGRPHVSHKKGVGLAERRGLGIAQLEAINVAWYYNWGPTTKLHTRAQFVPMIWSTKSLDAKVAGEYVLGYNEPDHPKQANLSVREALETWPRITMKAKYVGSPAMAGNPVKGEWFPAFMRANPKVDFVTVHWYGGVDAKRFIKYVEAVHEKYGKPIWVTEFAPQTVASSAAQPNKYTQRQVDQFIDATIRWLEKTSYVQRYAWHHSYTGTSALFDETGKLTATGRKYEAAHAVSKKPKNRDAARSPPQ